MTTDKIIVELMKVGNSRGIIIPSKALKFTGLKEGDWIEVWFKKKHKK